MAIIVILAIIAVITIPIILNVIDNSKRGAAIDSAYGYRDAIHKFFVSKMLDDNSYVIEDGEHDINYFNNLGVQVSGENPSDGWVELNKGEVVAFSLKFGDYVVTKYQDTEVSAEKNGEIAENAEAREARLESERQAEQLVVAAKVDSYVKAALANTSIDKEDAKTVSDLGDLSNKADSGWIHFNKVDNSVVVVDYSLTYGTITANYSSLTDGNYVSTFGESRNKPIFVGSEICYGPSNAQECFKVIKTDSNKTLLFANYNLKKYTDYSTNPATVTYKQESSSPDYIKFSESTYWHDTTNGVLKSEYAKDINNNTATCCTVTYYTTTYSGNPYPYVYNLQGTDTNNVKPYVDGYVSNLKTATYGLPSSATGRLLTYEEVKNTSMFADASVRQNEQYYYWLGSAYNHNYVWYVDSSDVYSTSYDEYSKVRPVIEISTSDIQ